jgi:hypothetical protein
MILQDYYSNNKIKDRIFSSNSIPLNKRIEVVKKIDYKLYEHPNKTFHIDKPIFTIVLTINDREINYIVNAINSCLLQTYDNVEFIIVDNGTTKEIKQLIENTFIENNQIKLIQTSKNLYNPIDGDFADPIINLWNAALFCSIGDYIYQLSCDDKISLDYVNSMVNLYQNNPLCMTTSPLVVSINEKDEINQNISENLKNNNLRDVYTNGLDLAIGYMRKNGTILFPGGLLNFNTKLLIDLGGFDNMSDHSQIFKIAINGFSGFDSKVFLYWRHHSKQLNVYQKKLGILYYRNCNDFLTNYGIKDLHFKLGGETFYNEYIRWYNGMVKELTSSSVRDALDFGFISYLKAFRNLYKEKAPTIIYMKVLTKLPLDIYRIIYKKFIFNTIIYRKLKILYLNNLRRQINIKNK